VEEQLNEKQERQRKDFLWMVNSSPKRKVPMCVYSPFTVVVSENVFCQGMVAPFNPVCDFLPGMLYDAKYVLFRFGL